MRDTHSESPQTGQRYQLDLGKPVDSIWVAELEKQAAYVSRDILSFRVSDDRKSIIYTTRSSLPDVTSEGLKEKLRSFCDTLLSGRKLRPSRIVRAHNPATEMMIARDVYRNLLTRGWVQEMGRGQVALRGPALNVSREIDRQCLEIAQRVYGATEADYPTLIPADDLARCRYFESFPQNASFVNHLAEEFESITRFRDENAGLSELRISADTTFVNAEVCLSPSVCYHSYRSLEGAALTSLCTLTAKGKCFRYESRNMRSLERLWDFTMREIVFVGTESEVDAARERGIHEMTELAERWGLTFNLETASDPFFLPSYPLMSQYQLRRELKLELTLPVDRTTADHAGTLACASVNLHEDFFGRTFDIRSSDGNFAFTGCLGWGLERWVFACFSQHGFAPDRWPEALRAVVFNDDERLPV